MGEGNPETPEAIKNRDMPVTTREGLRALGKVVNSAKEMTDDSQEKEAADEAEELSQPPDPPAD